MNWEKSKAATPLKRDFLKAFFEKNELFYLTGDSALGIFYLQHRSSYDMDFFTQDPVNWHLLVNLILEISKTISAECKTITASPQFYRFQLKRFDEREILDFVIEQIPQIDPQKECFGKIRVDTLREIMVNKICALICRCELKDVIDLYFLSKHGFEITDYFSDAYRKEAGLDPSMISFLLSQLKVEQIPEYFLKPLDLSDLKSFINDLREKMAELSFPE